MARPFRLPEFHYGAGASYFATFCTYKRQPVLSTIRDGVVHSSGIGDIVHRSWLDLPNRFTGLLTDAFIVMPDHVHGILHLDEHATAGLAKVIQGLKGVVTIEARRAGLWGKERLWQRSFFDRVIRNPRELDQIRVYIRNNPFR